MGTLMRLGVVIGLCALLAGCTGGPLAPTPRISAGGPVGGATATPSAVAPSAALPSASASPTAEAGPSWAGGAAQAWYVSGVKLGFEYGADVSPVSESVWMASQLVGDITQHWVGVNAASGKKLWEKDLAGSCAESALSTGEMACLSGNYGRLSLLTFKLSNGKKVRETSSRKWGWPAQMVATAVEPVGDDVIVAGTQVLSGDYEDAKMGDVWVARLGPDGTAKWSQRFAHDDTDSSVDVPMAFMPHFAHGIVYLSRQVIDVETGKSLRGSAGYPKHADGFIGDAALAGSVGNGQQSSAFAFPDGTSGATVDAGDSAWGGTFVGITSPDLPPFVMVQHVGPGKCAVGNPASVQAFDPVAGTQGLWAKPVDTRVNTKSCRENAGPVAAYRNNLIALLDVSGRVALVDSGTGAVRWRVNLGAGYGNNSYTGVALLSDGSVLITAMSTENYRSQSVILAAANGRRLWHAVGRATATPDGRAVMLADDNGGLKKLIPA